MVHQPDQDYPLSLERLWHMHGHRACLRGIAAYLRYSDDLSGTRSPKKSYATAAIIMRGLNEDNAKDWPRKVTMCRAIANRRNLER